jgi:TM2 domain-containing membrane protein YozV
MHCNNCGTEIADNAKFCGNCGKSAIQGYFCSKCGTQNKPASKFCIKCGAILSQVQAAPAPAAVARPQHGAPPPPAPSAAPVRAPAAAPVVKLKAKPAADAAGKSPKSKMIAAVLSVLFGQLGLHRLYAGKKSTALIQLLLTIIGYVILIFSITGAFILAAVGLWILFDFIMIFSGKFKDAKGLLIT